MNRLYDFSRLYDFTDEYLQAFDAIRVDEETGEVLGLEELETVNAQLEDKLEAVACYIKSLACLAEGIKAEARSLTKRQMALEAKILRLKKYLMQNMEATGKKGLETAKCKISFRGSSRVEIVQEDKLPAECWVVSESKRPDKAAIKKLLAAGGSVPGAVLVECRNISIK